MMRVPERQTWPAFMYWATTVDAAASRSASSRTTNGDLPPSSKLTGVRLSAAARPMDFAVSVDPVKLMRSTSELLTSAAPASSPMPCTTFSTPAGSPASCAMSASSEQVSGAHSGGLRTMVEPAASAGPTFHVVSMKGAFHGVMSAATPLGS